MHQLFRIIIFVALLPAAVSHAQFENVWVFRGTGIDFNTFPPTSFASEISSGPLYNFGEAAASVCDPSGQLLFYTEGTYVYNRLHQKMPNGDYIPSQAPNPAQNQFSPTGSSSQGTIIIPYPDSPLLYYIFSLFSREQNNTPGFNEGKLFYSVVDMSLQNGLGDVIAAQKGILIDSALSERMSAVAGDQCNIWLTVLHNNGIFKAYEITSQGIRTSPVVSQINNTVFTNGLGKIEFSPDRRKAAITQIMEPPIAHTNHGLILTDFDPFTGRLSNTIPLFRGFVAYGACFSPDSRFIYLNDKKDYYNYAISQIDTRAGNTAAIESSRIEITTYDWDITTLKAGPDGKIYFRSPGNNAALSVINRPDISGMGCDVVHNYLQLLINNSNSWPGKSGLPNVVPVIRKNNLHTVSHRQLCRSGARSIYAADTSGWQYQWQNGSTGFTLQTDTPGRFWVTYMSAPCNSHTDTIYVSFSNDSVSVSEQTICTNEKYYFNGRELTASGTYTDTFTSRDGCDSIVMLRLTLLPAPEAVIHFTNPSTPCIGDAIAFSGTGASACEWFINHQQAGKGIQVSITLNAKENHISLIATAANGCSDTAHTVLQARECCDILLPDAFTPNGDGLNDYFAPVISKGCASGPYLLQVFNRWGELVFINDGTPSSPGWDGNYKGQPAAQGVYFYLIRYELGLDKNSNTRKGDVTLLR